MTTTDDQIRSTVLEVLGQIAPEADLTALDPDLDFREQLDVDSMDLLNFLIGVHEALQVEIPESDYPKVASLNSLLAYVKAAADR
jgi:acyl carrier protein